MDGTITIDEAATHSVYFSRASISAMLSEHFGITELVRKDINGTSISATWDPSGYSGTISLAYMLSDGQCAYFFASGGERVVPLAEIPEDMMLQRGEIKLMVSQSSWAVLCKYSKTDRAFNNDFTRECVLYTTKPNLFLLARELEAYLENSSYGRFEGRLEESIRE